MASGGRRSRSGPPKKPTELKIIEGTFRKSRDGKAPIVDGSFPAAPEHLSASELQLWQQFPRVPWVVESDVIAVHGAVAIYDRILRNQRAQQVTLEAGNPLAFKVAHDSDGGQTLEPKENPLITQELKLWGRLMSILASLGLTPADRTKMAAPRVDGNTDDKWAGIL
jgi:hypothetical protein